jgi:hypothetical protein
VKPPTDKVARACSLFEAIRSGSRWPMADSARNGSSHARPARVRCCWASIPISRANASWCSS